MQLKSPSKIFKTLLLLLAITTVALIFDGCAVPIKDEIFYVDAGSAGALTVNFLSSGSQLIDKPDWDKMREGMYCMDAPAMADFKREIEKLCSKTKCSYQTNVAIKKFFARASKIQKIASGRKI